MNQVTIDIWKSLHIFLWANEINGFQCDETNGYHSSTVEGPTINQCLVTNPIVTMSGCEPSNFFNNIIENGQSRINILSMMDKFDL